jgi:REP-associated tyrosine transposase
MVCTPAGEMIQREWVNIQEFYTGYHVEAVQVMPNHIHGILMILNTGGQTNDERTQRPAPAAALGIGEVVKRFKMLSTRIYTEGVKNNGWTPFEKRLWQRNYWEHVIRNESEMQAYREYIMKNPLQWEFDKLNLVLP